MSTQMVGIKVTGEIRRGFADILSPEALQFLEQLERRFGDRRKELLQNRDKKQERINGGELPHFLPETESIRQSEWKVGPIPQALQDRRVEITGPVDRKMVINALNRSEEHTSELQSHS